MSLISKTLEFDPTVQDHTPSTPTLGSVIETALRGFSMHMRVCTPARVTQVRGNYRVDVQPLFQSVYLASGKPVTIRPIPNVPVSQPGGVNWQVKYPIDAGDVGWLIHADRALDAFCASEGQPADPADARTHDMTDAIYVPGLAYDSLAKAREDATTDLVLRNGTAEVRLERNGTFRVYSSTDSTVELVDLVQQMAQHCHDLVATLQAAMTVTMAGPTPLWGPTQSDLAQRLATITKITAQVAQLKGQSS